jgi:hypothetical protein
MWRRVAFLRTDVSEDLIAFKIRVKTSVHEEQLAITSMLPYTDRTLIKNFTTKCSVTQEYTKILSGPHGWLIYWQETA